MEAALYDEQSGYYHRPGVERWGRAGDYRTSPERSPLFAATFARYFADLYEKLDCPATWTIIEAGAGAGHFARGVLEALAREHEKVFHATRYVIDETSLDAIKRARERLAPFSNRVEFRRLNEMETLRSEVIIFSNELLDAFPVHRVLMSNGKLRELFVGLNESGEFVHVEGEPIDERIILHFEGQRVRLSEGQIVEVNLDAEDWIECAARIIQRGYLITVDYGAEITELYGAPHRFGGTLRAFHRHELAEDILEQPGERDITSTINWTQIKEAGERAGLESVTLERLDKFLLRAGLLEQLEQMAGASKSDAEELVLRTGAREMILPNGMSSSFQVLVQKRYRKI